MGKPDNDEEENASFIVYRVPGCSLHSCDYEKKKKTQGLNYYSHFREKKREVQRTTISSSKSHN